MSVSLSSRASLSPRIGPLKSISVLKYFRMNGRAELGSFVGRNGKMKNGAVRPGKGF